MHLFIERGLLKAPVVCLCLKLLFSDTVHSGNQIVGSHNSAFVEFNRAVEASIKAESENTGSDVTEQPPRSKQASKENMEALKDALDDLASDEQEYGKDSLGSLASLSNVAIAYQNIGDPKCLEYVTRNYKAVAAIIKQLGGKTIGHAKDNRFLFVRPMTTEIYYHYSNQSPDKGKKCASELLKLAVEMNANGESSRLIDIVGSVSEIANQAGDQVLLKECISTSKKLLSSTYTSSEEKDRLEELVLILDDEAQTLERLSSLRGKSVTEINTVAQALKEEAQKNETDGEGSATANSEADVEELVKSVRDGTKLRQQVLSAAEAGTGTGKNRTFVNAAIAKADEGMLSLLSLCESSLNNRDYVKAEAMFPLIQELVTAMPASDTRLDFAKSAFSTQFLYYVLIGNKQKAERALDFASRIIDEGIRTRNAEDIWDLKLLVEAARANVAVLSKNANELGRIVSGLAQQFQLYVSKGGIKPEVISLLVADCYLEVAEHDKAAELYRRIYPTMLKQAREAKDARYDPEVVSAASLEEFVKSFVDLGGNYIQCSAGYLQAAQLAGLWGEAFKLQADFEQYFASLDIDTATQGIEQEVLLQKLFTLNDLNRGDSAAASERLHRLLDVESSRLQGVLALPEEDLLSWQQQSYDLSLPGLLLSPDNLFEFVLQRKGLATEVLLQRAKLTSRAGETGGGGLLRRLNSIQSAMTSEGRLPIVQQNRKLLDALEAESREIERKLASAVNIVPFTETEGANTLDAVLSSLGKNECLVEFVIIQPIVDGSREAAHYEALIAGSASEEPDVLARGIKAVTGLLSSSNEFDRVKRVKLGPADQLDEQIGAYRAAIASGDASRTESLGKALYEILWKPVEDALPNGARSVLISPEKSVSFVPFAALNAPDGKFVGENFNVAYLGSARDLLRPSTQSEAKLLVTFANPVFDASPEGETAEESRVISGQVSLFGQIELPPLPGTQAEAEALAAVASDAGWRVDSFVGSQATEEQLRKVVAPSILHLATHGFYLNSFLPPSVGTRGMSVVATGTSSKSADSAGVDPMLASGVALTGAQQAFRAWSAGRSTDAKNDGVLTAQEVANLDLDQTWLVTLSACETGVGAARSGEGVFGLRRAFMMSGAEYLLMTLWPVADDTTAQIMADFYKEALTSGDATAALSEVQRRWLVKLRGEKGLGTAVRDAGAFAMVQMANPRKKQAAIQRVANPSVEAQQQSTTEQASDIPGNAIVDEPRVLSFEEAARRSDAGEAYAQAIVGTYYTYGYKVEKDEKKALEYLLKSAAQNHPLGIRSIGHKRLNGQGMEKNEQQGLKLIRDAFDGLNNMEGDPYALHALASDVLKATMQKVKSGDSKGISQQREEFLRLYQLAADKGYAPSQTMLAALLDTTTPESDPERPKRLQQARELLLKALAQNFQEATETWKEVFPKEPVPNPPLTSEKTNNPQTP